MEISSAQEPVEFSAQCEPLFNAHPLPMWLFDPETLRFLAVNDAAVASYGYSRAEFLAMTLSGIRSAAEQPRLIGIGTMKPPYTTRARHLDRAGREREVEIIVSEVQFDGRPARMVTALDVTQMVGAQERADRSEELLSVVADNLPDAVFVKDAARRYLFINRPGAKRIGREPSEMLGRTDAEIFGTDDFAGDDQKAMTADGPTMRESEVDAGGARLALSAILAPWRSASGEILGLVGIARDVTARRAAEAQLAAVHERYQQAFEHAPMCMGVADLTGHWMYSNHALRKMLGYTAEELTQLTFADVTHPEDRGHTVAQSVMLKTGQADHVEATKRYVRKDGSIVWARRSAAMVRDENGQPLYWVLQAQDITHEYEMKTLLEQAEHALEEREAELRQAQKMEAVGRLAGGIAHDFNNVLTAIGGHAEFVGEMFDEGHPVQSDVAGIRDSTERAARLTRQLLAFSRRQVMQPVALDLRDVLSSTELMLRRLIGEHIELKCEVPEKPMFVHADRTQIEQVILNLVVNSRDAMPDGGALTLSLSTAEFSELSVGADNQVAPGRYIVLRVQDSGIGIPPELLDKVFEPFFTTKEKGGGSGLGLSTVYGIVKQSGGHVLVASEPSAGTRVDILLPLLAANQAGDSSAGVAPINSGDGGETLLVVEDESSVRMMAERVLRRHGYEVLTATHGGHALEILRDHADRVSLVITDVVMPVMSGPELATALIELYRDIPIIFMSGYTADEINEDGISAAGAAYIAKPFAPNDLARLVRATLDKNLLQKSVAGRAG